MPIMKVPGEKCNVSANMLVTKRPEVRLIEGWPQTPCKARVEAQSIPDRQGCAISPYLQVCHVSSHFAGRLVSLIL